MADEKALSRYACDYCRKKKLRCSREKPKCKNCSSWTSGCVYSRDVLENKKNLAEWAAESQNRQRRDDEGRDHSEPFVQSPTASRTEQSDYSDDTPSSITSAFSFVRHVLEQNKGSQDFQEATSQGTGLLHELYSSFKSSTYDHDKIKAAVRNMRRKQEPFFIPSEPVGRTFVQYFLQAVEKAYPLLGHPPSQGVLFDLVFRPSSVEDRGWVLMFNIILATAATQDPRLSEFTFQLRWNAWLAADESSLFQEPTTLNIQALCVFAVHGQDLVTPSVCWNLIGQACRMAQTTRLHLPSRNAPRGSDAYSGNIGLFWCLFIMDKILSLSFGCPPMLPTAVYRNVKLPSFEHLSEFRPHLPAPGYNSKLPHHIRDFGAFFFSQCSRLALIMGDMSDYFLQETSNHGRRTVLLERLDEWISVVQQTQSMHSDLAAADDPAKVSVRIGFNYLNYQYHHLTVSLTRDDKSCRPKCLEAARAAISLLKGLVANSEEVFNGVVWQQLYMPFTPFFVLFGEVITNPMAKTNVDDLHLLRQTVLYYLEFQEYHASAVKLERVAETFTKIAEAYVRHVFRKKNEIGRDKLSEVRPPIALPEMHNAPLPSRSINPNLFPECVEPGASAFDMSDAGAMENQLRLDETSSVDATSLLHLFSHQGADAAPLEQLNITDTNMVSVQGLQDQLAVDGHRRDSSNGQYVSLRDVEMSGRYQFSNTTFDWFALEDYTM